MLNFRGTLVANGLIVTVDTRFDGGRHLRIARGIPGALVWACEKPVWWKTAESRFPTSRELVDQIRYAPDNATIVLCDSPPHYTQDDWFGIRHWVDTMNDVTFVVMGEFRIVPSWTDIHFRTGLPIELAEKVGSVNEPVGRVADRFKITKQQVRQCRGRS